MEKIGELYQSEDWKTEKHVPAIETPDSVGADELFEIKVSVGKEVSHPNTTEHHIRWVRVFFHPEGDKYPCQLASCEFTAHGEAAAGPNEGPAHTHHAATVTAKVKKPGVIIATSYCNIHGLWENSRDIRLS